MTAWRRGLWLCLQHRDLVPHQTARGAAATDAGCGAVRRGGALPAHAELGCGSRSHCRIHRVPREDAPRCGIEGVERLLGHPRDPAGHHVVHQRDGERQGGGGVPHTRCPVLGDGYVTRGVGHGEAVGVGMPLEHYCNAVHNGKEVRVEAHAAAEVAIGHTLWDAGPPPCRLADALVCVVHAAP